MIHPFFKAFYIKTFKFLKKAQRDFIFYEITVYDLLYV